MYTRRWNETHPERRREIWRRFNAAHREERNAAKRPYNRAYYLAHREELIAAQKLRDGRRPEAYRAYQRQWRLGNQDRRNLLENRRRVRKLSNGGSHTLAEFREKCSLLGNVCFYCGEAKPLVREHKIPLVRGGSDDITNILPACRSCNSKKGRRTAREYLGIAA